MAYVAQVENGKIVESQSQQSIEKSLKEKSGSSLDKEAFLQLLVAQMKYQDPLEPTSNTEYISQFATFSELEQMQNMSASMDLYRASGLVGKTVYVKTTDSAGNPGYAAGKVDSIYYEGGKAYLSINEKLYSLDDLDTVVDEEYYNAYNKAYDLTVALNMLPSLNGLSLGEREKVENIYKIYSEMNDYEKTFITEENEKKIKDYYERMQLLIKLSEAVNNPGGSDDNEDGDTGNTGTDTDGE
ncbi:MAG: flagellar hook capping protein [Lachnospiraceae bacterium]|nr:flagellar hook capping protein [Lachnospiraceae bacterium]